LGERSLGERGGLGGDLKNFRRQKASEFKETQQWILGGVLRWKVDIKKIRAHSYQKGRRW